MSKSPLISNGMNKSNLDRQFFLALKKQYDSYGAERREIIKISSDVLTLSKQAIFSFHRGEKDIAKEKLNGAEAALARAAAKFKKIPELVSEGSYRAALEEYTEAKLFEMFILGKSIKGAPLPGADEDTFLGGLFDLTGELVRYAVIAATEKKKDEVNRAYECLQSIAGEIISMNITGNLRSKYDQMKQSLRRMEEIKYDLSLRE